MSRFDAIALTGNSPKAEQIRLENGQVFGILEDTDENIWFGTVHGVCRFDGKTFTCFSEAEAKK
ncbi:MAG: two-component regulator propeller domain-containing protein [Saprospiraceae bacterium]